VQAKDPSRPVERAVTIADQRRALADVPDWDAIATLAERARGTDREGYRSA
jgi:hypothetical protein